MHFHLTEAYSAVQKIKLHVGVDIGMELSRVFFEIRREHGLYRRFDDSIGLVSDWQEYEDHIWEISYRTLPPDSVHGLLAAGRCISAVGDGCR